MLRYNKFSNEFFLSMHDFPLPIYVYQDLEDIFRGACPELVLLQT